MHYRPLTGLRRAIAARVPVTTLGCVGRASLFFAAAFGLVCGLQPIRAHAAATAPCETAAGDEYAGSIKDAADAANARGDRRRAMASYAAAADFEARCAIARTTRVRAGTQVTDTNYNPFYSPAYVDYDDAAIMADGLGVRALRCSYAKRMVEMKRHSGDFSNQPLDGNDAGLLRGC